jgi:hypothetical protein
VTVPGETMLYVKCKNPECGGEIKAPFTVRAQVAFSRMVNAEITCPFCRVSTTYSGADFHDHMPSPPAPVPMRAGGSASSAPSGPSGPSGGGAMPR